MCWKALPGMRVTSVPLVPELKLLSHHGLRIRESHSSCTDMAQSGNTVLPHHAKVVRSR